jgi:hypothetical protein
MLRGLFALSRCRRSGRRGAAGAPVPNPSYLAEEMTDPGTPSPRAGQRASAVQRAALSRELSDFLIELSIALHKHAMYPDGHPTLAPSSEGVARRLAALLADRGTLSLGVARDQLVIEGVATDPRHPVLKDLAERLHAHHLGAVSYARGVSGPELDESLRLLARDAARAGEPLGLRPLAKIASWPHIRLYPLSFDRLQLLDAPDGSDDEGAKEAAPRALQAAQLWVGLARAALASEGAAVPAAGAAGHAEPAPAGTAPSEPFAFRPARPAAAGGAPGIGPESGGAESRVESASQLEAATVEPAVVAQAIESHERGTAYDQVIVGYMLQIAAELKVAGGSGAVALQRRMSKLIGALDPQTLARLLEMGGDLAQRRQFILDASQGMAVDAVVDLVRAASSTGAPVSRSMLRMLVKLGHHAEQGPPAGRALAESGLREQVAELVRGWALLDPNPGSYAAALERMAAVAPALLAPGEAQFTPEPVRLAQMACETGSAGDALARAADQLMAAGATGTLLDVLERAPAASPATAAIASRIASPETIRAVLAVAEPDFALLDRLLLRTGEEAADPMLDVLAASESRQVRRALMDRLIQIGPPLGPYLVRRLGDERWYVVRNLLCLAAELPAAPGGLGAVAFVKHADFRVRREALRAVFKDPESRTRALCTALTDADSRVRRLALAAVADAGCPAEAVPLVVTIAAGGEASELRVNAVRVLAAEGGRLALEALLRITRMRRSLFGTVRRVADEPEFLAALAALGRFRADRRARARLEQAAASRDPATAKAAAGALQGGS